MALSNQDIVSTLNNLTQLLLASEKGFNVAAENVQNRGLKVLFKTYAQQRSQFGDELQTEVAQLGGEPKVGWKPLASLHRGWINIKAGMTIGSEATEQVVLSEALRGENVAIRNYEQALRRDLPSEIKAIVERQYEHVQDVTHRVRGLSARSGDGRTVVRLFDTQDDAEKAIHALQRRGIEGEQIAATPINQVISFYEAKHKARTVLESAGAGAALGMGLGVVLGIIAGASAMALPMMGIEMDMGLGLVGTLIATTIAGLVIGLVFGGFLGALIGVGIAEDDSHRYIDSINRGTIMLIVEVNEKQAEMANRVMMEVNAARTQEPTHSN